MKLFPKITLVLALLSAATQVQAQNIDEVLKKHYDAQGGVEKLTAFKTSKMEGDLEVQGMSLPFKITQVNHKGMRMDFEVMGQKNTQVVTNTTGWNFMPIQGQSAPVDISEAEVKNGQDDLDITGDLFDYKAKGHTLELIGKETLDGKEVYKVQVTRKNAKQLSYYIDATTYLLSQRVASRSVNGTDVEITEKFSNYWKTDDGYMVAGTLTQLPMEMKMNIKKAVINEPVDETIFQKPAAQ